MGCSPSKIENEEAVTRCKERKQFMKDAVSARNAFAAAHSAYAMSLKNTGAALSDYAHGEVPTSSTSPATIPSASSAPFTVPAPVNPQAPFDTLLPPPPLPTEYQGATLDFQGTPLQRATSMPEMKTHKPDLKPVGPTINEDEEMEFEAPEDEKLVRKRGGSSRGNSSTRENHFMEKEPPPLPPQPQMKRQEEVMRPPPVVLQETTWDYFFPPVENMPGPTLAEPVEEEEDGDDDDDEERRMKEEEAERKAYEIKASKRLAEEERVVMEEQHKVEKAVEVPVPVPVVEKKPAKKLGGDEVGRRMMRGLSLMQIFTELDNHFLAASESAHEVSKMLEATKLHYHSNFADNRGHIDHSARVMRVITWNRSFKGVPNVYDGIDEFDSEEHETHATVLDKMLAWEKKLYDEVKAGEVMKFEYQRKVALLNKQKKRGSNPESLEKLKAAVSHLHTRMAIMWDTMRVHHEAQSKIVYALRSLDISQSPKETSEHHHDRTYQLWAVVREWHAQFCGLIDNQKAYMKSLNNWLKLNLIPIESSLKEKVSSPLRVQTPPIQQLLMAWHDFMDKLPDEVARTAISNFAAVIETIMHHQDEEMKLKEKCEETRKDLGRKTRQFEDWYNKYMQRRSPEELDPERPDSNIKDAIAERQFTVDAVKKQLEEEEEAYQRICLQVREKSLASLKTRLPELFRAMCDVALACSEMYRTLRAISQRQKKPSRSS
ncbi:Protein ROLLING AND ERECT LEAF 2 [Linum perenne]